MSQRKVRARDVDRDAAIEIVEAAWADGQLSREEYEQRTDRLLRAPELRDLEREIADLQPEGTQWRPAQQAATATTDVSTPRRTRVYLAAGLTAVVAVGLILVSSRGTTPSSPAPSAQAAASTSLLTPASFIRAREELSSHAGSDAVYSAALTDQAIEFVRPTSAAGTEAVEVTWNGQWGAEQTTSIVGERLSLGLVNAESVSTIVADARRHAGEDAPLTLLFQIERRGDQRICITATAAGDPAWTGTYDCQGREMGN